MPRRAAPIAPPAAGVLPRAPPVASPPPGPAPPGGPAVRATARYTLPVGPDGDAGGLAARLVAAGARGLWERGDALVAWFDAPTPGVPPGGRWEPEPARDWMAPWRARATPVRVGALTVVPAGPATAEHGGPDPSTASTGDRERAGHGAGAAGAGARASTPGRPLTVVVVPGPAFGTGHHATTALCLLALQEVGVAGRSVLDVGTGTGVLAVAAALLGADPVVAVDVDPAAVRTARRTAARNRVEVDVRQGGPAAAGRGRFTVVVANLSTATIREVAASLAVRVGPTGWLVASGITAQRAGEAAASLRAVGLQITGRRDREGWAGLLARHPGPPPEG